MFSSVFRAACCDNTFTQAVAAFIHVITNLCFTSVLFCVTYAVENSIKINIFIVAGAGREERTLLCFAIVLFKQGHSSR